MSAILPSLKIDSDAMLGQCFMPHQIHWIQAEDAIRTPDKSIFALAEKCIRESVFENPILLVAAEVTRLKSSGNKWVVVEIRASPSLVIP